MTAQNYPQRKAPGEFMRIVAGIGVSLLTAVMLILAFHPYNAWFLAFFAFVPMLVAQSVLRAVENRLVIVKADAAYAAAIIDPYGKVVALRNASPDGAAFALVADVPLSTAGTLYSKLGDWVGWLSLAGLVFFIVLQERTKRQHKVQSQ